MADRLRKLLSDSTKQMRIHIGFLMVLITAAFLWSILFQIACIDFIAEGSRPFRASWLGYGQVDLFGYTVTYNFEGWVDYDYFYISWADQFLSGIQPYTDRFEVQEINDWVFYQPYFLPPLFLYVCTIGRILPIQPFGIGLIITIFGYLTSFPVYGIVYHLSKKKMLGIASSITYLFNPVILYYTVFQWLNPAPFVFFVMLSFYFLIRGSKTTGLLLMVTAALFKQIALFFALPLIASILIPPKGNAGNEKPFTVRYPDLTSFYRAAIIAIAYAIILSFPYILNPLNYLSFVFGRIGSVYLADYSSLPGSNRPITVAVLFILFGAPEGLVQIFDTLQATSILLAMGIIPSFWKMLRAGESSTNQADYWKKMLFLTLLMIFWVHIFSPRGIFKYYTVALIPFVSILPYFGVLSNNGEKKLFPWAIINPFIFSLLILLPDRNLYILFLIVGLLLYSFFGYRDELCSMISKKPKYQGELETNDHSTDSSFRVPSSCSQSS